MHSKLLEPLIDLLVFAERLDAFSRSADGFLQIIVASDGQEGLDFGAQSVRFLLVVNPTLTSLFQPHLMGPHIPRRPG